MAQSVSNGGVGKSPAIDKINRIPKSEVDSVIAKEMTYYICDTHSKTNNKITLSFEKCATQVFSQVSVIKRDSVSKVFDSYNKIELDKKGV